MVTVTFYGNGGMTAGSEDTVVMKVKKGTRWMDVVKPEFLQPTSVNFQNGFTLVKDDDNTVVDSSFIVVADMVVWASYTALEIGVITNRGEVMSAQGWISKYGVLDGTGVVYQTVMGSWNVNEPHRDDLIRFVYFKLGDRAFGLSSMNFSLTGMASGGRIGGDDIDMTAYGFGLPLSDFRYYLQGGQRRYPFLYDPPGTGVPIAIPQDALDKINSSMFSGKGYCDKLYELTRNHTDNRGIFGCAVLENIREIEILGVVPKGMFYIASIEECKTIYDQRDRLISSIFDPLSDWKYDNFSFPHNGTAMWHYEPGVATYPNIEGFVPVLKGELLDGTILPAASRTVTAVYTLKSGLVDFFLDDIYNQYTWPYFRHTVEFSLMTGGVWVTKNPYSEEIQTYAPSSMGLILADVSHLFS